MIQNITIITQPSIQLEAYCQTEHHGFVDVSEIISDIEDNETIAAGSCIREIEPLRKAYGSGRWRKLK